MVKPASAKWTSAESIYAAALSGGLLCLWAITRHKQQIPLSDSTSGALHERLLMHRNVACCGRMFEPRSACRADTSGLNSMAGCRIIQRRVRLPVVS